MRAPSCDSDLLDGSGTDEAWLSGAHVDAVLKLKEAPDAICIHIIGHGRAAELDGVLEHFHEGGAEAKQLCAGKTAGLAARTDAGAKEAFVGVDVADAVEQGLVQERGLDGGSAALEETEEVFFRDGEGLGTGPVVGVCGVDGEAPEATSIDEAKLVPAAEREDGMGVRRAGHFRCGDEQAAGHAKVDQELGRRRGCAAISLSLERHDDGLADTPNAIDAGTGKNFGDLGFGALKGLGFTAGPDGFDALTVDAVMDAVSNGFDLWKLGHPVRISRPCA